MSTFGPGDYGGYNNYAYSGSNTYWTNWNGTWWTVSGPGRVTALAARWDAYCGFCGSTTGHNDLWINNGSTYPRVANTGDFGVGCVNAGSAETMHNAGCADYWQNSGSQYAIGFWRGSGGCSIFGGQTNAGGGYCGKSADDLDITGCVAAWAGTGQFGLPCYATVTDTNIWVRRSGGWNNHDFVYVRRSGGWSVTYVYIRRSGTWQIMNLADYLNGSERHIPERGLEVKIRTPGYGIEDAVVTEDGHAWFGSFDPTIYGWDWHKPGSWPMPESRFTGRYDSRESDEIVDRRSYAYDQWERALKRGDIEQAETWELKWRYPNKREAERQTGSITEPMQWTHTTHQPTCRPSQLPKTGELSTTSSGLVVPSISARTPDSSSRRSVWAITSKLAAPFVTTSSSPAAPCDCPHLYEWEREAMMEMAGRR